MGLSASTAKQDPSAWDDSERLARYEHRAPCPRAAQPERNRNSFGIGPRTVVRGWPSTGGCLVLSCDGVELDFLGLDRFKEVPRSTDPDEEDAHCMRMRKLGPTFWASERDESNYQLRRELVEFPAVDDGKDKLKVFAWPFQGGCLGHQHGSI